MILFEARNSIFWCYLSPTKFSSHDPKIDLFFSEIVFLLGICGISHEVLESSCNTRLPCWWTLCPWCLLWVKLIRLVLSYSISLSAGCVVRAPQSLKLILQFYWLLGWTFLKNWKVGDIIKKKKKKDLATK